MNSKDISDKKLGIVIVTYCSNKWIGACINSILESDYPIHVIIIIDNASPETVELEFLNKNSKIHHIKLSRNIGFGRANNIGIGYCLAKGSEYIALINPDIKLKSNALAELAHVLNSNVDLGVVGGLELNYDDDEYNPISKNLCYKAIEIKDKKSFIYSTFKDGEHLNASLLMLKKGVFLTIGGFDPVFFMYAEDYDILRRALRIDIKLAICNSAQYHHAISHSYKLENVNSSFTQTKIRHYSRSRLIYALANPYTPFTVNLLRVIFVFLRGLREYISAPRLLRAFLISFFDVPWIKCYAKWRRDRLKNYQYYIDAIMVPKDVSLISKC